MRNDECTIYFMRKGKVLQSFRKDKEGWKEQLVSHLLPALAFGHACVRVVPDKKILRRASVKRIRKLKC
jgi:hypothetical protein